MQVRITIKLTAGPEKENNNAPTIAAIDNKPISPHLQRRSNAKVDLILDISIMADKIYIGTAK